MKAGEPATEDSSATFSTKRQKLKPIWAGLARP